MPPPGNPSFKAEQGKHNACSALDLSWSRSITISAPPVADILHARAGAPAAARPQEAGRGASHPGGARRSQGRHGAPQARLSRLCDPTQHDAPEHGTCQHDQTGPKCSVNVNMSLVHCCATTTSMAALDNRLGHGHTHYQATHQQDTASPTGALLQYRQPWLVTHTRHTIT